MASRNAANLEQEPGTRDREVALLLRGVEAHLQGRSGDAPQPHAYDDLDWSMVRSIARANKLDALAYRGLSDSGVPLPSELKGSLQSRRDLATLRNSTNLFTLRELAPLFASAGVPMLVMKGPLQQEALYGDYFVRPSGDVDLLVGTADYDRSAALLAEHGYVLAEVCATPWWRHFLGEQPFLSSNPARATVDLHFRTQQPGCPAPRRPHLFFERSRVVRLGELELRTLSETDACLLSCMSLVKAMLHREPAGSYACDTAAYLNGGPGRLRDLLNIAERQGLRNTALTGLRAARLLFNTDARQPDGAKPPLAEVPDADFLAMILQPDQPGLRWPKRRHLLWELCDDKIDVPKEMLWNLSAELARQLYERRSLEPKAQTFVQP